MTTCPYCHRDEQGEIVAMDTAAPIVEQSPRELEKDIKLLESEDAFVRDQAATRLAQKSFSATPTLIGLMQDHKSPTLPHIARILGRIGDKRAIAPLAQAARGGDEELRMGALWALAQFREPEVLPVLLSEAERAHPVTQSYLVHVLGGFHNADVIPVLAKLVSSPNAEVAFHAVSALGGFSTPASTKALQSAIRRKEPLIKAAASASLRRQGHSPAVASGLVWKITLAVVLLLIVGGTLGWFYR